MIRYTMHVRTNRHSSIIKVFIRSYLFCLFEGGQNLARPTYIILACPLGNMFIKGPPPLFKIDRNVRLD